MQNRQAPICGIDLSFFLGMATPLISQNYPNNYPSSHSCNWKFSVSFSLSLGSSRTESSQDEKLTRFRICGTSTYFQNPVNVGRTLSARLYAAGYTGPGLKCTVTCGQLRSPMDTHGENAQSVDTKSLDAACKKAACSKFKKGSSALLESDCGMSQYPGRRSGDAPANSTGLDRIVGGTVVPSQKKYPWMVWIRRNPTTLSVHCGGSLINDRYVLTAAHCVYENPSATYYVVLGDLNRYSSSESVSIQIPARAIPHQQFLIRKSGSALTAIDNDIALLKLETPVDFQGYPHIRPICLPKPGVSLAGVPVAVAGWGAMSLLFSHLGIPTVTMLEANLETASDSVCQKNYGSLFTKNFICAQKAGKDICHGDSGGPLMHRIPGSFYFNVGINSFTKGCDPQYGAAFTATANYVNSFIGMYTNDAEWCAIPGF
ncbi:unnamed protein product [Darwinula stevensoni]|uniref:Peptidase S1 domain-containing protein n=1 Tax=Darwinula stevensoni TaxID=69355 RepID=A0A7R9AFA9_9CRUS|nr:unnamed protein product [Darwinula stevensoni]CAG0903122.1 unnamed protein product [Darwinula stevensoni]